MYASKCFQELVDSGRCQSVEKAWVAFANFADDQNIYTLGISHKGEHWTTTIHRLFPSGDLTATDKEWLAKLESHPDIQKGVELFSVAGATLGTR